MKRMWIQLLILLLVGCSDSPVIGQIQLETAFPNLSFTRPVDLQNAGDGSNRLFVVEQRGVIRVFANDPAVTQATVFLDISGKVDDSSNEEGLLGLVFHPDFPDSAYFYVNYTASGPDRSVIARYRVMANNPNQADPNSELVLLTLDKPYANHNAGALAFGPKDGYLYITTGDGGSGGDPHNNGQNLQTLLGSILRIDVDQRAPGLNYAIPPDNPFAGNSNGWREEIFAYGLRNPWRISFDPGTGGLWCGDVGQNAWEEVDIIESGKNYGWRIMEGNHCFNPPSGCHTAGLTLPVWEYGHNLGASITGGYVYRGAGVPELNGKYIYADFVSGRIWALTYDGVNPAANEQLIDTNLNISSFGVDEAGELYFCAFDGRIYRFKPTAVGIDPAAGPSPRQFALGQNYPNPFNPGTLIPFWLETAAQVRIRIFDGLGQLIHTLIETHLPAGAHSITWSGADQNGKPVASGRYFYQMTVNGQERAVRQMTLLK